MANSLNIVKTSSSSNSLPTLPAELAGEISSYLTMKELKSFILVSTTFARILKESENGTAEQPFNYAINGYSLPGMSLQKDELGMISQEILSFFPNLPQPSSCLIGEVASMLKTLRQPQTLTQVDSTQLASLFTTAAKCGAQTILINLMNDPRFKSLQDIDMTWSGGIRHALENKHESCAQAIINHLCINDIILSTWILVAMTSENLPLLMTLMTSHLIQEYPLHKSLITCNMIALATDAHMDFFRILISNHKFMAHFSSENYEELLRMSLKVSPDLTKELSSNPEFMNCLTEKNLIKVIVMWIDNGQQESFIRLITNSEFLSRLTSKNCAEIVRQSFISRKGDFAKELLTQDEFLNKLTGAHCAFLIKVMFVSEGEASTRQFLAGNNQFICRFNAEDLRSMIEKSFTSQDNTYIQNLLRVLVSITLSTHETVLSKAIETMNLNCIQWIISQPSCLNTLSKETLQNLLHLSFINSDQISIIKEELNNRENRECFTNPDGSQAAKRKKNAF